jgi:hypothetical protein
VSPVARPAEIVTATLCVSFATETVHGPVGVPVSEAELAVLLHDWIPGAPEYDPEAPTLRLAGQTAWGDRVDLPMDQVGRRVPGPDARRILDRLAARAGRPVPTVDPSSSAADVVAAYVDLLNLGRRAAAAKLWMPTMRPPDLPAADAHIDVKVEGVKRLRFVPAWRDATWVRALYHEATGEADAPYREAAFTLGRDEDGIFRLVSFQAGDAVPTGR